MTDAPQASPQVIPNSREMASLLFDALDRGYVLPAPGHAVHIPFGAGQNKYTMPWPEISMEGGFLNFRLNIELPGESAKEPVCIPIRVRLNAKLLQVYIGVFLVFQQSLSLADLLWASLSRLVSSNPVPLQSRTSIPGTPYSTTINLAQPGYSITYDHKLKSLRLEFPTPHPRIGEGSWLWAEAVAVECTATGGRFEIERRLLRFDVARDPTFVWG